LLYISHLNSPSLICIPAFLLSQERQFCTLLFRIFDCGLVKSDPSFIPTPSPAEVLLDLLYPLCHVQQLSIVTNPKVSNVSIPSSPLFHARHPLIIFEYDGFGLYVKANPSELPPFVPS